MESIHSEKSDHPPILLIPRVLFFELAQDSSYDLLQSLFQSMRSRFQESDVEYSEKEFKPHLTLWKASKMKRRSKLKFDIPDIDLSGCEEVNSILDIFKWLECQRGSASGDARIIRWLLQRCSDTPFCRHKILNKCVLQTKSVEMSSSWSTGVLAVYDDFEICFCVMF